MAKLVFDVDYAVDTPTLLLETKTGRRHGQIRGTSDIAYRKCLQEPNEFSCKVSKYVDGSINSLWNEIVDLKSIYIPEFEEKFEIKVSYTDESMETKAITGTSLCEAELGQILIRNLEVNSESDIARDDYEVTVFYNPSNTKASLLHRVLLQKAPHYSIGHVDDSLKDLAFEFSSDKTNIYDFLTGDVAEKMQCLFIFDSVTRTISAYDLCSTCSDCYDEVIGQPSSAWKHYRGDFHDVCPNCGSTNITEGYGADTAILIDRDNFATSIAREGNVDSLKNCFFVEGGDDLIDAAFVMANPNGSQYVYYFSPEIKADMPSNLVEAIDDYSSTYDSYCDSHVFNSANTTHIYNSDTESMSPTAYSSSAPDSNFVTAFNNTVNEIVALSEDSPYSDCADYLSESSFTGHSALVNGYYNSIDFETFLQTSMMPTYEMETYNKYHALSLLNAENFGTVAISGTLDNNTARTLVENAILSMAKALINTALYSVDLCTSSYSTSTYQWTGTFTITDLQNTDDTTNTITNGTYASIAELEGVTVTDTIPSSVTVQINNDYVTYSKNKIAKILAKEDLPTSADLYSVDTSLADFQAQANLHSIDNLTLFYNVMSSCCDVLLEEMTEITDKTGTSYTQINTYYQLYRQKMNYVNTLLSTRETQILSVKKYKALMNSYIAEVQSALDFQTYLHDYSDDEDLWEVFNCYRREDTYTNQNIISDDLNTNAKLLQYAGYLMDFAKKELIKAGTIQYSFSTSLNNLLVLPEFKPFLDDFEVGNWIRIRTDIQNSSATDLIYKLRLLSYEIKFDEIQNIEVEFSTADKTVSGYQDVRNILSSAKSMATSYSSVQRQVEKSADVTKTVNGWMNDGLALTSQKIVNDAENQDLVIDNHGLLARKFDELSGTYDLCQLKIFDNGLYTTSDGWNTVDAGVGKIMYVDQATGQTVVDYGIISKTLVCTNGKNSVYINPNNADKLFRISNTSGDCLYTDSNGNLNITGALNGGSINIGNGNFVVSNTGEITTKSAMSLGNGGLTYDTTNGLSLTGNINATGGTFSNTITCSGTISGGTISGATINGGTINIGNSDRASLTYDNTNGLTLKGNMYLLNGVYMWRSGDETSLGDRYVEALSWIYSTEEWKLKIGGTDTTCSMDRTEIDGDIHVGLYNPSATLYVHGDSYFYKGLYVGGTTYYVKQNGNAKFNAVTATTYNGVSISSLVDRISALEAQVAALSH